MAKHDRLKQEKAARNELYSLKYKKKDKQARKQARRLRVKIREERLEKIFWDREKQAVNGGVFVPPY